MSHFTVLYIGNDDLDTAFAPFNEATEDPRFLTFNDHTDEYRTDYETESRERIRRESDGAIFEPWDDQFKNPEYDRGSYSREIPEFIVPEGFVKVNVPLKELYATFEDFVREYHHEEFNSEGRLGYMRNPNAKWDWYQVGGRWAGFFRIKPEALPRYDGAELDFSWGWSEEDKQKRIEENRVDEAFFGDIDFETPRKEAGEHAAKVYDFAMSIIGDLPATKPWTVFVEEAKSGVITLDQARVQYNSQPRMVAYRDFEKEVFEKKKLAVKMSEEEETFFSFGFDVDDMNQTREEYIAQKVDSANSTFAILKDGVWYERGEMGWFACVSNEKDGKTWNQTFRDLLKDVSPDTKLTLVDCHI